MLEYVFFNAEPRARFCFLREHGIEPPLAEGELERLVQVEEDLVDDALADTLDAYYDEMFELDHAIYSQVGEDGHDYAGSGVVVNLKDGTAAYANVPPALLAKVMQALTHEELSDLVNAIVDAVERPGPAQPLPACPRRQPRAADPGGERQLSGFSRQAVRRSVRPQHDADCTRRMRSCHAAGEGPGNQVAGESMLTGNRRRLVSGGPVVPVVYVSTAPW